MPRKPTTDGGHTIFTDHRIARRAEALLDGDAVVDLRAWRDPKPMFRERNLGLALADFATQKKSAAQMVEAFRLLYGVEKNFSNDPAVLTALASLLFVAQDTEEAEKRYRQAVALMPDFAPYQVNLAAALLKEGSKEEARQYLERALQLDPLLESGVQILSRLYRELGEKEKAENLWARYRLAMGYKPQR
jgi:predicted Zn-dependent protease